jgi:hypothetical protein
MNDGKLLHFLKNFPAWFVLSLLFIVVLWLYLRTADQFLQRVVDTILGGLLGVVTGRGLPTQSNNTGTGDVIVQPEAPAQEIKEEEK